MSHPAPSRALAPFRILDLTRVRAGPTCVRQFADCGADVIKIESAPGADPNEGMGGPRDGPDMQNLHRNKRSLNLNLKRSEAHEVFERLAKSAGVPCGPICAVDEVFADPQVAHLQAAVGVEHPRLGKLRVLNQAARLSRTPAAVVSPTPEVGQHTDEVLADLRYNPAEISALRAKGVV